MEIKDFEKWEEYTYCVEKIEEDWENIQFVPEKNINEELCVLAIQKSKGLAIQYLPEKLRTERICEEAVKKNKDAIRYVKDKKIFKKLLSKYSDKELRLDEYSEQRYCVIDKNYNQYAVLEFNENIFEWVISEIYARTINSKKIKKIIEFIEELNKKSRGVK
jgi:hypothetical protein